MSKLKLLLCTDLDGTVIPNGKQLEHPQARQRFADFCALPEVSLVYVTGRHKELVQQAVISYGLPESDFTITDVGSKVYQVINRQWVELKQWEQEIDKDWNGFTHQQIELLLCNIPGLCVQERSKQNTHKLSYYLPLHINKDRVLARIQTYLNIEGIDASLIWSTDNPKTIGFLDVLPKNATKLHAIEFLQQYLGYKHNEVIFAGDSGNDLLVLGSHIHSVLVANASDEIKQASQQLAKENDQLDTLYVAESSKLNMNANFSAGVLEGVLHYAPEFRGKLL